MSENHRIHNILTHKTPTELRCWKCHIHYIHCYKISTWVSKDSSGARKAGFGWMLLRRKLKSPDRLNHRQVSFNRTMFFSHIFQISNINELVPPCTWYVSACGKIKNSCWIRILCCHRFVWPLWLMVSDKICEFWCSVPVYTGCYLYTKYLYWPSYIFLKLHQTIFMFITAS